MSPEGVRSPGEHTRERIEAAAGKELAISLNANPSTGYSWEASFDDRFISLVRQDYRRASRLIGGGGTSTFTFLALVQGRTVITMRYRRPWEPEAVKVAEYEIEIA
ncbi:MAG: protease inhibitor I42 family protein [Methanomassiliicoccus sp.]|nr:protease inhibitor I42 family protein [Methanomassiliicoccus sp.]